MTNTTFGEIDYNTDIFGGEGKKNTKDLFLRLVEGSNELRLVTQPYQYLTHKYKKEGDPGFGQKVGCSMVHGSCPLCELGEKAKTRWFYGVIDRKTGLYKVLDVSFMVFDKIRKLARNTQRWGDPMKYDIDIVVDKNGGSTGYYSVQPVAKEPLSAADQVIKDNADLDDLKRRCTPPTPEQVQKRLDRINGLTTDAPVADTTSGKPTTGKPTTAKPVVASKPTAVPTVDMTDDEDDDFPAFDGN